MIKIMKIGATLLLIFGFFASPLHTVWGQDVAQQEDYEQWSRIAIGTTKIADPDIEIIDYKHIGREDVSPTVAAEKFRLVLKKNDKRFEADISVQFEKETKRLLSIAYQYQE